MIEAYMQKINEIKGGSGGPPAIFVAILESTLNVKFKNLLYLTQTQSCLVSNERSC